MTADREKENRLGSPLFDELKDDAQGHNPRCRTSNQPNRLSVYASESRVKRIRFQLNKCFANGRGNIGRLFVNRFAARSNVAE